MSSYLFYCRDGGVSSVNHSEDPRTLFYSSSLVLSTIYLAFVNFNNFAQTSNAIILIEVLIKSNHTYLPIRRETINNGVTLSKNKFNWKAIHHHHTRRCTEMAPFKPRVLCDRMTMTIFVIPLANKLTTSEQWFVHSHSFLMLRTKSFTWDQFKVA